LLPFAVSVTCAPAGTVQVAPEQFAFGLVDAAVTVTPVAVPTEPVIVTPCPNRASSFVALVTFVSVHGFPCPAQPPFTQPANSYPWAALAVSVIVPPLAIAQSVLVQPVLGEGLIVPPAAGDVVQLTIVSAGVEPYS
jgi:hypothetical protein